MIVLFVFLAMCSAIREDSQSAPREGSTSAASSSPMAISPSFGILVTEENKKTENQGGYDERYGIMSQKHEDSQDKIVADQREARIANESLLLHSSLQIG